MNITNIQIDQTVHDDNLDAGSVTFEKNGESEEISWSVYLWPQDHDVYPGVRNVSLTDDEGNELNRDEYHVQLKEAILNHIEKYHTIKQRVNDIIQGNANDKK